MMMVRKAPNKDVSWKREEKQVDSSFDAVSRIADPDIW